MRRKFMVVFVAVVVSLLAVAPAMAAPAPSATVAPSTSVAAARYHIVRFGETLFSIGRLYGVSPWAIAQANHLPNANRIYSGQCLYIPPAPCYYCSGYRPPCGYYGNYYRCRGW